MLPKPLVDLTKYFEQFPGIGPRQAGRFAFFLMKQPSKEREKLIETLTALARDVELCTSCYLPTHKNKLRLCVTCQNPERDPTLLCVVEKESDALNMEQAGLHRGRYFILGGNVSPIGDSQLVKNRLDALFARIQQKDNEIREIILALNNTREGNFTSLYMQERFKKHDLPTIKITRLGRGLATGNELEYLDEETLSYALKNRQ